MPDDPAVEGEETYGLYRYRWLVLRAFMLVTAVTQIMWLNYAPITSQTQKLMGAPGLPLSEFKRRDAPRGGFCQLAEYDRRQRDVRAGRGGEATRA